MSATRGFLALLRLELLTELRDRGRYSVLVLVLAWCFAPGPANQAHQWLLELTPGTPEVVREGTLSDPQPPCDAEEAPSVTVVGAWPAWLSWPEPFVPDGGVRLTVTPDPAREVRFEVDETAPASMRGAVKRCLYRALATARRARMAELGLAQDPGRLAATTFVAFRTDEVEPSWLADLSLPSLGLALLGFGLMGTLALEAVPRRRASGLLEQLRSTATSAGWLVGAWLVSIGTLVGGLVLACGAAFAASAATRGLPLTLGPLVHVGPLLALTGAASLRSSLPAQDLFAASLRWSVVLVLTLLGTGVAAVMMSAGMSPGWVALVPMGGSWIAASGLLGPWAWLADLMALVYTGLVVVWSAWLLETETSSASGASPVLLRQARGNFLPEALLLAGFGMAAAVLTDPSVFGLGLAPAIALVFGVMMVLPSLAAAPLLGVPVSELVPLRAPGSRNAVLSVPVAIGLMGLAPLVLAATTALFPISPLQEELGAALRTALDDPAVQLAIVVGPAIAEELLFRGAVLGLLLRSGRPGLAIVGQAALFAVAHALAVRLPWTFVVGLVLGVVRWRTGSLWLCMGLHAAINGAAVLGATTGGESTMPSMAGAVLWLPLALGLLGLLGMRAR